MGNGCLTGEGRLYRSLPSQYVHSVLLPFQVVPLSTFSIQHRGLASHSSLLVQRHIWFFSKGCIFFCSVDILIYNPLSSSQKFKKLGKSFFKKIIHTAAQPDLCWTHLVANPFLNYFETICFFFPTCVNIYIFSGRNTNVFGYKVLPQTYWVSQIWQIYFSKVWKVWNPRYIWSPGFWIRDWKAVLEI